MDVNLSCIDISMDDLLRCSFGLSRLEVGVLKALLDEEGWTPVGKIASRMRRDRSVVQRGLSSLLAKKLIVREQANKPHGGYEYLYMASDKKAIKRSILGKSRAFCMMVNAQVSRW